MRKPGRPNAAQQEEVQKTAEGILPTAINDILLGLPEGVAKGTPLAMGINKLLGGLPEKMIEAAGGKERLLQTFSEPNVLGSALGFVSPLAATKGLKLVPGLGKAIGGIEKAVSSPAAQMAIQGGSQAARSGITGQDAGTAAASTILAGGAAGLGSLVGKGLEKVSAGVKAAPEAAIEDMVSKSKLMYLANALPDLAKQDLKTFYKDMLSRYGSAPKVEDKLGEMYDMVKSRKLDQKAVRDSFIAAQPARWQQFDAAAAAQGDKLRLVNLKQEIDALPEVQELQSVMKQTGGDPKDFDKYIITASGGAIDPTGGKIQWSPESPSFSGVRAQLGAISDNARKVMQAGSTENPYQAMQQKALDKAINSVRDFYMDKVAAIVAGGGDAGKALAADMKADYALAKLMNLGEKRGATDIGGLRPVAGSLTAARQNPLAFAGNLLGQPAQAVSGALGRQAGKALGSFGASPFAQNVAKAGIAALPGPAAGATGGYLGQATMRNLMPKAGMPEEEASKTPVQQVKDPKAAALNMQFGLVDDPLDAQVYNGLNELFNNTYRDRFSGYPEKEAQARKEYIESGWKFLHQNGGKMDPVTASRALFPRNELKQSQFIDAYKQDLRITESFKSGAFSATGPGPIGSIARYLSPDQAAAYTSLEAMAEQELGSAGKARFATIANNPMLSPDRKLDAIRQMFSQGQNAEGWRLYTSAIGGNQ